MPPKTLLSLTLLIVLLGCSKMTPEEAKLRREFSIPAERSVQNLGEVELKSDIPKTVSLGKGKTCTITATGGTNGMIQLNLDYSSEVDGAFRKYTNTETLQFLLPEGKRCAPTFEKELTVVMRPKIVK